MTPELRRRLARQDRIARWVIAGFGLSVILSVLAILLFIGSVAIPLFLPAGATQMAQLEADPTVPLIATGSDTYLETGFTLNQAGFWQFYDFQAQIPLTHHQSRPPEEGAFIVRAEAHSLLQYTLLWSSGHSTLEKVVFYSDFTSGARRIEHDVVRLYESKNFLPDIRPDWSLVRIQGGDLQEWVHVEYYKGLPLQIMYRTEEEDFLGNVSVAEKRYSLEVNNSGLVTALTISNDGKQLYVGTSTGRLLHWTLGIAGSQKLRNHLEVSEGAITALGSVFGDRSLAIGDSNGKLSVWSHVRSEEHSSKQLKQLHELTPHETAITAIQTSQQDKSLLSLSDKGIIHFDAITNERHLLRFEQESPITLMGLTKRNNGLVHVDQQGKVTLHEVASPHPEVSWQTLFGKVWYESYLRPDYIWQSSSGSDDFEPKLSLIPLLFGSIKGTLYGIFFAAPLALLAAIYTNQFLSKPLRQVIKPMIEIMAAIPSVVIGFLAALWLAPVIGKYFLHFFVALSVFPFVTLLILVLQNQLLHKKRRSWLPGKEFLIGIPVIFCTYLLTWWASPVLEAWLFGGNFQNWLFQEAFIRYDQRNSIIIAFGLGFMVIPILFTMTEDALSNVPENLKVASLALGASRWQTVWRVILPSASPGIFAALIIGFGRAIGETMVVLMATGNTPIIDWSPFNGMRTLSANISVEMPEAPVDGTLYRTLFLSAMLLFVMTSFLNTLAELIRQQLRKRYGNL